MHFLDVNFLIQHIGLWGVMAIVFVESGLLFGFFLPGDSLLFAVGFMASRGIFHMPVVLLGAIVCTVLSGYVGYWFGLTTGHELFEKADSLFFKKRHLEDTKKFFEKYGDRTIIISRFVPVIRTFAPTLAGIGEMDLKRFSWGNLIGGILWPASMVLLGYYLGHFVPAAEKYFLLIVVLIIVLSVIPGVYEWLKNRKKKI